MSGPPATLATFPLGTRATYLGSSGPPGQIDESLTGKEDDDKTDVMLHHPCVSVSIKDAETQATRDVARYTVAL